MGSDICTRVENLVGTVFDLYTFPLYCILIIAILDELSCTSLSMCKL